MNNDFSSLSLKPEILQTLAELGYKKPTPIQQKAIPQVLKGQDLFGCAQTGTGKTAAFLLPILNRLLEAPKPKKGKRKIKTLILAPTRELAAQIAENCAYYAKHSRIRHMVIFGGVSQVPQVRALRKGIDILIATPGRLLDLYGQGYIDFNHVESFILDEADRMLDMGFIPDIRRILSLLPKQKQSLLFSATMPKTVISLAQSFLNNPAYVEVDPESSTVENIEQKMMYVAQSDKKRLLKSVISTNNIKTAIVFTRTKRGANRVVEVLQKAKITAAAIHGNKSQNARTAALQGLSTGKIRVLVATDVAARGIDISKISHVFNFDIPNVSETYVHRIGRTGRAGEKGIAISFVDQVEVLDMRNIEKLIGKEIPLDKHHEWHCNVAQKEMDTQKKRGFKAKKSNNKAKNNNKTKKSGRKPKFRRRR